MRHAAPCALRIIQEGPEVAVVIVRAPLVRGKVKIKGGQYSLALEGFAIREDLLGSNQLHGRDQLPFKLLK